MSLFRRLTVLAGAAEAARRYARSNPDKAGSALDKAAQFVDKQTKGKYTNQISGATRKAKDAAGIPQPGFGYGAPGTTPPAPGRPAAGNPPDRGNGHRPGDYPQAGQGGGQGQQPPAFPPNPGDPRGA
ncbi:antitoxin [Pseudonocardia nantongensis]|uniref:antitoxin n=1 Tax=Pseudonocardia nantongensis TaxID=1181885 RepID=UPI00397E63D4